MVEEVEDVADDKESIRKSTSNTLLIPLRPTTEIILVAIVEPLAIADKLHGGQKMNRDFCQVTNILIKNMNSIPE